MPTIKPATEDDAICIGNAIECLKQARYWLRAGQAPRTLDRVNAAIRSAAGAKRHVEHRISGSVRETR